MDFSRRKFLKGAAVAGGAMAGGRILGPMGEALAAEKTAVVCVYFQGGYNSLFGSADSFLSNGIFNVTNSNVLNVGNGVFTDKSTIGTMPKLALDHMAAIGVRHGITSHFSVETALLQGGGNNYLLNFANAIGGNSALKAVYLGGDSRSGFPGAYPPAVNGTSLQHITDMKTAINALGGGTPDPRVPDRAIATTGIDTAKALSQRQLEDSPTSLAAVQNGLDSSLEVLKKPVKPFSFDELAKAYGLPAGDMRITTAFATKFAAAELMIRAGTNVVCLMDARDTDIVPWDFHQVGAGGSLNGTYSRSRMTSRVINPLRVFLDRMMTLTGYNVVTAVYGDFGRSPRGDHIPFLTPTVFGKYVKQGTTGKVSDQSTYGASTPGIKEFYAYLAAVAKVPGTPFGANPHALVL